MSRRSVTFITFAAVALLSSGASAADTWTDPAPGIRQLVRTAPGPLRYVAVTVDLTEPEYFIRATRPEERGQTVSGWAGQTGAVVAINGDFFDAGYQPVGLAVGDGVHWEGTNDQGWSFIACTIENDCEFDDFTTDQERHHLWHEVVGGNGWRLLIDGNVPNYPPESYYSDRHPRSGVGMSQDGNTMIFAVVEGRRNDSIGLGFADFGQFFKDLGAYQALMLDGGGSSALVVNGSRVSRLPSAQGSERVVANHIGILRGTAEARCAATPNGRYCEGSVIHTCRGGQHFGNGDCGAFGASCEVTADGIGVCVHPSCTGGANGSFCEDDTIITTCDYGTPAGSGDCAAYGSTCETGEENSYCVHFMCTEGGNAQWCRDNQTLASCADGQPEDDIDCGAVGNVCVEGECVPPEDPNDPDDPDDPSDPSDPSDPDDADDPNDADDPAGGDDDGTGDDDESGSDELDGTDDAANVEASGGCQTTPAGRAPFTLFVILLWLSLLSVARSRRVASTAR